MQEPCEHMNLINEEIELGGEVCPQCVAMDDSWVNLRQCLICGQVGCCDSSKNKHATGHYKETGHALITDALSPLFWIFCYEDQITAAGPGT